MHEASGLASQVVFGWSPLWVSSILQIATNIVIAAGERPWFRNFRRGGDDFTSVATQRLQLTKDQAEQAKNKASEAKDYVMDKAKDKKASI